MALIKAHFAHANLIARDFRKIADFYIDVLGCTFVPPERDYHDDAIARGTSIPDVHLKGVLLRLPGFDGKGPMLEIFSYEPFLEDEPRVHRLGYGHLGFAVDDVEAGRAIVLENGGAAVGEVVTSTTSAGTQVTWCYCTDPEGNVFELQRWG